MMGILFQLSAYITNSSLRESEKDFLNAFIKSLSPGDLFEMLAMVRKYPEAVGIYAEFFQNLTAETKPVSMNKMETLLAASLPRS